MGDGVFFPRDFFDLQFQFAERVRALAGISLGRALFEYTNFYVRFGCGRDFDPEHGAWREYLAGLSRSSDPQAWTYRFYLTNAEMNTAPPRVTTVGCFSYALQEPKVVRLHFQNADTSGTSPLHRARAGQRRAELARLVAHVKLNFGDSVDVTGTSWLYNLDAYRRLFPVAFTASSQVVRRFRSMALWGQFIDHRGQLKARLAEAFVATIEKQSTFDQLSDAFPLRPLATRASLQAFVEC